MRIVTFAAKVDSSAAAQKYRVAALRSEDEIVDLTGLLSAADLTAEQVLRFFDLDGALTERARAEWQSSTLILNRRQVRLTAPVPRPGKIICIGLNYRDHAAEVGTPIPSSPIIFSKFVTSVTGPNQPILIPPSSVQVDYEAELAFIIGRRARNVKQEDAMTCVFGYTNFNDVSARDFQFSDGQWQRGKSCDTFAPFGEFIAMTDEIPDPHNLRISFRLNGRTLQDSNTSQLIFNIPRLIEFLSESITLEPGDVVATGTPPGVGFTRKPQIFMKDGDVAEVEIEGLGILSNPVAAAE